jgi:hypothetical protein
MNKSEPTSAHKPVSLKPGQQLDYAAWVDSEGQEHLITRDMVDEMIEAMVSGSDYSLQGPPTTH